MSVGVDIEDRRVSSDFPTYIIAEMSANHHQDFDRAVQIVQAAADAGADAIKVQTYTPDTLTLDCDNEYFQVEGGLWEGRSLYKLYEEAYMPWEWQPKIQEVAKDLGLDFLSTAYDESAVDFLEKLNVPVYKIASFELVDIPLLRIVAKTGKPVILSTGMATLGEIDEAVHTLKSSGCEELALLKCNSAYPAPPEEMNLQTIPHLSEAFGVPVGLSDHTLGTAVPIASVTLGACIVEKHFTLSRDDGGLDSAFSLEPEEFKLMVDEIRTVEKALGKVDYSLGAKEAKSREFRRSLFVVEDIKAGEEFTAENVRSIRPGYGASPKEYYKFLGKKAARNIKRGTPLSFSMVEK